MQLRAAAQRGQAWRALKPIQKGHTGAQPALAETQRTRVARARSHTNHLTMLTHAHTVQLIWSLETHASTGGFTYQAQQWGWNANTEAIDTGSSPGGGGAANITAFIGWAAGRCDASAAAHQCFEKQGVSAPSRSQGLGKRGDLAPGVAMNRPPGSVHKRGAPQYISNRL